MNPKSPHIVPPGVDHGLLAPGSGKRRLLIRDLISQYGKGLIVTVHLIMPGIRDDLRLSGMNALLYDVHAKSEQRLAVLEAFNQLELGALVTSMSAAAKLRLNAPLLLFTECSIAPKSKPFLEIIQHSGAGHVHYVNCNFGPNALSTLELLGIQKDSPAVSKLRR